MEKTAQQIWDSILCDLEDKLQFGVLEQARAVISVEFNDKCLTLKVFTTEARDFFSTPACQQRLVIISRPVAVIEEFKIELVPLPE
jgi:tRNA threonylcarbamoyladenosine modification (KEOPS) complex  Pcc1 subunit